MQLRAGRTPPPLDDPLSPLLARISQGDEAALGVFYDATSARVFGLAIAILRNPSAAEEATLDVYSQVWRQAGRFDPAKGNATGWLLTLARSRAIDLLRSRSRTLDQEEALDGTFHLRDEDPGPERASLEAERARRVRAALAALPPEQRQAIEAAFFGGLSHSEVAAALGQPLGTIKTRIRTGLSALRRALASVQEDLE